MRPFCSNTYCPQNHVEVEDDCMKINVPVLGGGTVELQRRLLVFPLKGGPGDFFCNACGHAIDVAVGRDVKPQTILRPSVEIIRGRLS
jgi:hypothetical protein